MAKIAVGDVMTRNFFSVSPDTNLLDCAKKLVKNRIGSLLVTLDSRLLGIITERDILWTITKKPGLDLKKLKAIEIATKKVAVIKPSADINQAIEKMKALNFKRLPVLARGKVIGMLTLKDILRIEPSLYNEITELHNIREEESKLSRANVSWPVEGFCESCGTFSELLKVEGKFLCLDCRDELY